MSPPRVLEGSKMFDGITSFERGQKVLMLLLFDGSEVPLQFGELWSVLRVVLPAALHHFVHVVGTTLRTGHPVA